MKKFSWTDRVKRKKVLHGVLEVRNVVHCNVQMES